MPAAVTCSVPTHYITKVWSAYAHGRYGECWSNTLISTKLNAPKLKYITVHKPVGAIDLVCRPAEGVDHLGSVLCGTGGYLITHVDVARNHAAKELLVGVRVYLLSGGNAWSQGGGSVHIDTRAWNGIFEPEIRDPSTPKR